MNREQQKQKAMWAMNDLGIDKDYIQAFVKRNTITMFIHYMGYFIDEKTEYNLLSEIKKVEEEYGICVYAVTQEQFEFGRCFTMLYISKYDEDAKRALSPTSKQNTFIAHAYVYNADDDWCSEFGSVQIKSALGGIRREY